MRYIRLGYIESGKIEGMTGDERHAMLDECFERNDICAQTDILLPKRLFSR